MAAIPSIQELQRILAASGGAPGAAPTIPALPPAIRAMADRVVDRELPAAPSQRVLPPPAAAPSQRALPPPPAAPRPRKAPKRAASKRQRVTRSSPAVDRRRGVRNNGSMVRAGTQMKRGDGTMVTVLASHAYAGRRFGCYGRRVTNSSGGKTPRLFCSVIKPTQKKGKAS